MESWGSTRRVVGFNPVTVGAAEDAGDPLLVGEVPLDGLADAGLEGFGRAPAKLALDLARVDGVAAVVAGAVGDVGNQAAVAAGGVGLELVEQRTQGVHDLDVRLFVPAAHVVHLARGALGEHRADGAAVVGNVQPVADLLAVAVHGQGLAGQCVGDHQRNELLGEVIRAVVVGAVAGGDRQAVGMVPGAHQMVGGGLAGGVRAVGLVGLGL